MTDGTSEPDTTAAADPAALAAAVLDDADRHVDPGAPGADDRDTVDDADLPGVGDDAMSLREALGVGGKAMVVLIGLAQFVEWIDRAAFNVLAPDIQKSLHVARRRARRDRRRHRRAVLRSARSRCRRCRTARPARKLVAITMTIWSVIIVLHRRACRTCSSCSSPGSAAGLGPVVLSCR